MAGTCTIGSSTGKQVLAATLLASGSAFIAGGAVTVALPAIQRYFGTIISAWSIRPASG